MADSEPVPFVVNNDGSQSIRAAEVFFASLLSAEQQEQLPAGEDIFVLELGIGVGLFARYFLDWFTRLCETHGKDYYQRLTYLAADPTGARSTAPSTRAPRPTPTTAPAS